MISGENEKRLRAGLKALIACALAASLTGCPQLEVEDVSLASVSAETAAFTVSATVVVTEDDPAVDDDGDLSGGRGLLGIWLPEGWAATGARVQAPGAADFAALTQVPDGDGHFPPPFPWVPGAWSAFASPCDNIEEGIFEYGVEIDVSGPEGATGVVLGIATALFDEAGSNGGRPVEVAIDLSAGTADVRAAPAAPTAAGLTACEAIPYEEPPDDDCTCAAPGVRRDDARGLLAALLSHLS
jgi:hypothetical protein